MEEGCDLERTLLIGGGGGERSGLEKKITLPECRITFRGTTDIGGAGFSFQLFLFFSMIVKNFSQLDEGAFVFSFSRMKMETLINLKD